MKPLALADLIIGFSSDLKQPVTNKRLQLSMYLLTVIYLVETNEELMNETYFVMTDGLPAFRPVLYEYSIFDDKKIKKPIEHIRVRSQRNIKEFSYNNYSDEIQEFIWNHLQKILSYSDDELITMIQSEPQLSKRADSEFINYQLARKYWIKHKFWEGNNID